MIRKIRRLLCRVWLHRWMPIEAAPPLAHTWEQCDRCGRVTVRAASAARPRLRRIYGMPRSTHARRR